MKREFIIADVFGPFCADGSRAAAFRMGEVEPYIHTFEEIVFDFSGVRNINDSFANALISPVVELLAASFRSKIRFKGCTENVRIALTSAVQLGVDRSAQSGKLVS
jgi:hypothetical protein